MNPTTYTDNERAEIRDVLDYPNRLSRSLQFLETTASVTIPPNPIDRVVFQDDARTAVKAAARNRGNILLIGRPGVGKSMLANMFEDVMSRTLGDYLRQRDALVAIPGRDRNRIKIIGMDPPDASRLLDVT
ncbi:MAG: ATP-binding protein, partial [Thermodesulfobacteriota bacterium]